MLHVIGGKQLKWPPLGNQKEEEKSDKNSQQTTDTDSKDQTSNLSREEMERQIFIHEMGFSLVIEAIIAAKKPLIGHNCMYDWLYVYNQFIGPLPETFADFAEKWHEMFPHTFDNKVLCANAKAFYNTTLGTLYDNVTSNEKFKHNLNFRFDTHNSFTSYDGSTLLQHYHEAAYDAHMTGVVFTHVAKFKELDSLRFNQRKDDKELAKKGGIIDKKEHEKENRQAVSSLKHKPIEMQSDFMSSWINKMMLDGQGSDRVYNLNPESHSKAVFGHQEKAEFPKAVHLTFAKGFVSDLPAEQIANLLSDFGDFFLYKDNENSCFVEFFELN